MGDGMTVADAMALMNASKGDNDGGIFGGNSILGIVFIVYLMTGGALFGGFGGRYGAGVESPAVQGALTRSDLFEGFNDQEIVNKLDGISRGICDAEYTNSNLINGLNTTVLQGFGGITQAISELGYKQDQCCCATQRAIDQVRFDGERNACSIIEAVNNSSQRIIDQLTRDKMDDLRTELQSAQLQLSNNAQTANLIATLRPFPQPAYITCSPYTAATTTGCCPAYGIAA